MRRFSLTPLLKLYHETYFAVFFAGWLPFAAALSFNATAAARRWMFCFL